MGKPVYQEENSTFTSDGVEYDLNTVFRFTADLPTEWVALGTLNWNVSKELDAARVEKADLAVPLLVLIDKRFNKPTGYVVIDGNHRLEKHRLAKKELDKRSVKGIYYVPVKFITLSELKRLHAVISNESFPIWLNW